MDRKIKRILLFLLLVGCGVIIGLEIWHIQTVDTVQVLMADRTLDDYTKVIRVLQRNIRVVDLVQSSIMGAIILIILGGVRG